MLVPLFWAIYWMLESFIHSRFFDGGSFASDVVSVSPHELWMRGVVFILLVCLAAASDGAIRQYMRRIDQLTLYQQRLREMASRLAEGDDDERRQLGDRLHEHVAQTLVGASLFVSGAKDCEPGTTAVLRSVRQIIELAITECREIAATLSPPMLHEFGLEAAVEEFARRISRRTGIPVETSVDGKSNLHTHGEEVSFRTISDIVLLAITDPTTTRIRVALRDEDLVLRIVIEWDAPCADEFFEIRERVVSAGGEFWDECAQGNARFIARVPAGDAR